MTHRFAHAILLVWLAACASSSTSSTTSTGVAVATVASQNHDPDVITLLEIEALSGVNNAMEVVQRLRPQFLRSQGRNSARTADATAMVRMDGKEIGDLTSLRQIELGVVKEIRYYSIVEAETRFGGVRGRPVINIVTRGGKR